ncbi:DedD protein [Methylomarinovum caldicuralii]|uniref:DedD protein n=1 Tax=Methylomarinovum caldicuralii TaxID=438856 RepID=A0AAU9C720_9GAMM|nr:SPOR domain-containing protein [Methylomarinovum caldicuralii]BCX83004.1 DedD protein [Methylomarinovum caldicuralii]
MDLQLKRRLVGGAVLVFLAVIFLPMLFEDGLRSPSPFDRTMPEPPAPGEAPARIVVPDRPHLPLSSGWAVQVGSFSSAANADALVARLRQAGFPAYVARLDRAGESLYRVRVGPVLRREEAETLARRLRERFGLKGFVVSHP